MVYQRKKGKKPTSQAALLVIWELSYVNNSSKMRKDVQRTEATGRGQGGNTLASNDFKYNYCGFWPNRQNWISKSGPLSNNYFLGPLKLLYYVPLTDVRLMIRPVTLPGTTHHHSKLRALIPSGSVLLTPTSREFSNDMRKTSSLALKLLASPPCYSE